MSDAATRPEIGDRRFSGFETEDRTSSIPSERGGSPDVLHAGRRLARGRPRRISIIDK